MSIFMKGVFLVITLLFLAACNHVQQPNDLNSVNTQLAQSGSLTAWSGGRKAWSGGRKAWSGGTEAPDMDGAVLLENAAIWDKLSLIVAHKILAQNLGKDVIVAVIDTGVDHRHPIFIDRLTPQATWRDFVSGDANPQEVSGPAYGHGTVVASIVLQVAPQARIMPLRVLGGDGAGNVNHVASAINWAVNKGAKVIQLSLGTLGPSSIIEQAVARAATRGVYVVTSAGNSNSNPTYPAYTAMLTTPTGEMGVGVGSVNINDVKSTF